MECRDSRDMSFSSILVPCGMLCRVGRYLTAVSVVKVRALSCIATCMSWAELCHVSYRDVLRHVSCCKRDGPAVSSRVLPQLDDTPQKIIVPLCVAYQRYTEEQSSPLFLVRFGNAAERNYLP